MTIETKNNGDFWVVSITVKSGNHYSYNTVFDNEPTERQIKTLWREDKRNWSKL
jgi:hypothetical protein